MANEAFPLDVIQEEEPEEDLEEWQRTNDPAQLKQHRTQAKRIHTMALNQALLAVRMQEDAGRIEIERTSLVRAYDIVERIHRRYVEVCKFDGEDLDRETSWGIDISIKHSRALTDMANYIDSLQARARSVAGSSRSSVSNRSSTSSTRRKLQEAERLEKETQLRIQQEKAEALQQAEEEERRKQFELGKMQLEIARKAEEKRVEAARKERQLKMELEKQRYTSSLLRKQLADELAETEETDEIETSGFDKTDVWKTSNVPFHAPATPVPEFCMPYRPATTTQPCSQHWPAASQQPFTFD
ncbi:putative GATA zinc finger domain-containing protein 25 [Daphnia carinata]|uniref:putative GATA zinc finger domain-containing protein 25 n=1 Tax=Daphnia carinata TaxID=120202 RepID=UPI00257AB98D|nr:putative GATA zinc finger domain-containing protein 25 [Daphnia carinata]